MCARKSIAGGSSDFTLFGTTSFTSEEYRNEADVNDAQSNRPISGHEHIDLSNLLLEELPMELFKGYEARWPDHLAIGSLNLSFNQFLRLPAEICSFKNITSLDAKENQIVSLPNEIGDLDNLSALSLRNNLLEDLPKGLQSLNKLDELNLGGNLFEHIPPVLFHLNTLKQLYLGGNRISSVPTAISKLINLEVLYLGGNFLEEIPASMGRLSKLVSLTLADNRLQSIPDSFAELRSLKSLALHNNQLKVLPIGIARLRHLEHLSLRNNPLVRDFVDDTELAPPSLKEIAGRIVKIKIKDVSLYSHIIPKELLTWLNSANRCVNPKCKGVYFEACAELVKIMTKTNKNLMNIRSIAKQARKSHPLSFVKFVDFCGKYRVPLLHYLCSVKCSTGSPAYACTSSSESDDDGTFPTTSRANMKMKKILIG